MKAGQGKMCDVTSDKWPGANVKQSKLNSGSDKNPKGSAKKMTGKKKLMVK